MLLTNPPIRRSVMLLCFGAAGLLLASEWQLTQSQPEIVIALKSSRIGQLATIVEQSPLSSMARRTRLVIRLGARKLEYYEGSDLIKQYDIAVGQADWETPVGHFAVLDLRENPLWKHPITGEAIEAGPDNPLGSRWIGFAFDDGYHIGIHGTNQEELVGQAVSHGCVRMRDSEIQEVFGKIAIGTPITVQPD
ncbi:MAG: L,D-transpeptidase [Cyanobacteria bacterium P01_H01_bin.153]